jgi:hypothetical protein
MLKLSIIFGEIPLRGHGNFEQECGVLKSFVIIINYYITYYNYILLLLF